MKQHADTIINLQNLHGPLNSAKLTAYSDAMNAFGKQKDMALVLALEGKAEEASAGFAQAYATYLICRDNADFETGARSQLQRAQFRPNRVLCEAYGKFLVEQGCLDDMAAFVVRLQADYGLADDDTLVATISKRLERARKAKPKVGAVIPNSPYQVPADLPSGWERAVEGKENVVRLSRSQQIRGFDYLGTMEPAHALRHAGKFTELLDLMKQAVIATEIEAQKEKFTPPTDYSLEAARACREMGDHEQEWLFLHRFDVLLRRYGRADPDIVRKLGKAWCSIKRSEA